MFVKGTTEKKLSRVKIQMMDEFPFWAYLILKLKMREDLNNEVPEYGGMGVTAHGDLIWKREFVDSLNYDELKAVLAHEVSHLILMHLTRLGNRDPPLFNIACDIAVNYILQCNNFSLPECGYVTDTHNKTVKVFEQTIKDLDKKNAEIIYDELLSNQALKDYLKALGKGKGKNKFGFDAHSYAKGGSESEINKLEEKWKDGLIEAATHAKQKGSVPGGMDEYIGKILDPKVNWRHIVQRYVINHLPYDFSFSKFNKKYPDIIMPGVVKENVEMVVAIDTSGSLDDKELAQFLGEIVSIARSHHNLKMTLIECDCAIQQVLEVSNGNIEKILNMKIKGRGGTSHQPVVDLINKKYPTARLLICLTDGFSDIETCFPNLPGGCDKLIVLSEHNCGKDKLEKYAKVVEVKR